MIIMVAMLVCCAFWEGIYWKSGVRRQKEPFVSPGSERMLASVGVVKPCNFQLCCCRLAPLSAR